MQVCSEYMPKLYPNFKCSLCGNGRGNEFHIFCSCHHLKQFRRNGVLWLENRLKSILRKSLKEDTRDFTTADRDRLFKVIFPGNREDFFMGLTPLGLRQLLLEFVPAGYDIDRVGKKVGIAVLETYKQVWDARNGIMCEKKMHFADRLKSEYNMTLTQYNKKKVSLWAEYRARVRLDRERRAAQQAEDEMYDVYDTDTDDEVVGDVDDDMGDDVGWDMDGD